MEREQLKYLLKKYKLHPRRENGQNFLINPAVVKKLIQAADLNSDDVILEIGAGLGALTAELCKNAKTVIAVEQDRNFIPVLNKLKQANQNLEIINEDIFKINFVEIMSNPLIGGTFIQYKIVANLPFNITSLVFRHFLENGPMPESMAVIIQKEVADRITAKPGQMSLLSVAVQLFGQPKIEKIVTKNNFYPQPEVDCAVLTLKNIKEPKNINDVKAFFGFLHIAFAAKRKKLANNLANGLKISKETVEKGVREVNLSENTRAQELSLKEWLKMFDHFKSFMI